MFRNTESSSEGKVGQLIWQNAAIISSIPANGVGQIPYIQSDSRYSVPTCNEKNTPIKQVPALRKAMGNDEANPPSAGA